MGKLRNFEKIAEIRRELAMIDNYILSLLNSLEKAADNKVKEEVHSLCRKIDYMHSEAYSILLRCRAQKSSAIDDMKFINYVYDMKKYYLSCAYDLCDDVFRTQYLDYRAHLE